MATQLRVLDEPSSKTPGQRPAIDDFGFDPEFTERVLPLLRWLYEQYWRVDAAGIENVPGAGRAMLVANHGGVVPYDGAMIRTALRIHQPEPRYARLLVLDWAFAMPFLSEFMQRTGSVVAHPDNAVTLLRREELVGVFPEGARGPAKPYRDRYRLRRFGRGGFVQVALRTASPIIPVAVVGSEEVHPILFDLHFLAEWLGLPAFPITPTWPLLGPAGLLPLPSKWAIEFGEPIDLSAYGPEDAEDAALVLELTERVRTWIQARIYRLLSRRRTPFF